MTIKLFWKMSLLVMRCGFMVMISKPDKNPHTLEKSWFTLPQGSMSNAPEM
jgi:hypothetical protein